MTTLERLNNEIESKSFFCFCSAKNSPCVDTVDVLENREKAIKVCLTGGNKTAWIPKSALVDAGHETYTLATWFRKKCMENGDKRPFYALGLII